MTKNLKILLIILGVIAVGGLVTLVFQSPEVVEDVWEDDWEVTVTEPEEAWTDKEWNLSVIKKGLYSFGDFNIAVDSENKLHVICDGIEGNNIDYLYQTEEGYGKETIIEQTFGGLQSTHPDIAIGEDNIVHVAYFGGEGEKIVYVFRDDEGWQIDPEATSTGFPRDGSPSIALDDDGFVHITHWSIALTEASNLHYLTNKNEEWERQELESEGGRRSTISLAVDSEGDPHVSYITKEDREHVWSGNLFYGALKDNQWKLEKIEKNISRPEGGNVLVDSDGYPRVVYKKDMEDEYGSYSGLAKAVLENGEWVVKPIEVKEMGGYWGSTTIDDSDQVHIAYDYYGYEGSYRWHAINYVRVQGDHWEERVVRETAKREGDIKKRIVGIDLVIDGDGKAHIVYLLRDSSGNDNVYSLVHLWEK